MSTLLEKAQADVTERVILETFPNIEVGFNLSGRQRRKNADAYQAAITYCSDNGKILQRLPTTIEIENDQGLFTPEGREGFAMEGFGADTNFEDGIAGGSRIIQYGVNTPVISLGGYRASFKGLIAEYGVDQVGQEHANAIIAGRSYHCNYEDITYLPRVIDETGGVKKYSRARRGFSVQPWEGVTAQQFFFSCRLDNIISNGCLENCFFINLEGTGNEFHRLYAAAGGHKGRGHELDSRPLTDAVIRVSASGALYLGNVFSQINMEWFKNCPALVMKGVKGSVILVPHIEGAFHTQEWPKYVTYQDCTFNISGMTMTDNRARVEDGVKKVTVFHDEAYSQASVRTLKILNSGQYSFVPEGETEEVSAYNAPTRLFERANWNSTIIPGSFVANDVKITDAQDDKAFLKNFYLSDRAPKHDGVYITQFQEFKCVGRKVSLYGAYLSVDGDATIYGWMQGSHILAGPDDGEEIKITLSKMMAKPEYDENTNQPIGHKYMHMVANVNTELSVVSTGSGTVTVQDDEDPVGELRSLVSHGQLGEFFFNGLEWLPL